MRFRFVPGALCLALLLSCFDSAATTIQRLSVEKMTEIAQTIARGRCVSNVTQWERGEIWTVTSFEITETWKGAQALQLSVHLLGGTLGGLTSNVSGVPRFRVGEDVILFLEPTKHGGLTVVSWQQGAFRVRRNLRTGLDIVTQDTAAFETFDSETRAFRAVGVSDVPLNALRARVQAIMAASTRGKS